MGSRSGPLFSLRTYDELFFPEDHRVCQFFAARGIPVILHSCGNVKRLIPRLIEAGYAGLNPLEVKAGMDLVELKKAYGDVLTFMGGIDVRQVADPDPRLIAAEIATKVPVAMQDGGYIYALDGPVLPGTSLERYCYVMELVRYYGRYDVPTRRNGEPAPAGGRGSLKRFRKVRGRQPALTVQGVLS
jgi:uroporphyrinogen decarboxylase